MEIQKSLLLNPDSSGNWTEACPKCNKPAACRLRPDTKNYAELRCPACRHFRWLRQPVADEVDCGFIVIVDSNEQLPYGFKGFLDNSKDGHSPRLIVPTDRRHLDTGDYSILGYENLITIERKSKSDLWSSISQARDNFVGRLERMESFEFAAVVVEASWDDLLIRPEHTKYSPKSLSRTIQSWLIRYRTKWLMMPTRQYAEAITFRLLQRYWIDKKEKTDELGRQALRDGTS